MEVIKVNNLTKYYGKNMGIKDISFTVNEGEIFGFVGPNGAGKSTTIKILLNYIFPTRGTAEIFGLDIVKKSRDIKKNIGYVSSENNFYGELKVKDILKYADSFYNKRNSEYIKSLCDYFSLNIDKKTADLSLGNKKKLSIIQALAGKPKLLILDEPTNGLDPLIQQKLFKFLAEEKSKGTTIFFSSHNLADVGNLCDRVAIVREGQIVDILDTKKVIKKSALNVVVKGENLNVIIIKMLGGEDITEANREISFTYYDDVNKLIKNLAVYNLRKITINEKKLEDVFINYYL